MAILRAFDRFVGEAAIVGKMLAGYADLEIDLMHCVNAVRHDLNGVLKAMFRARGEKQRIDIADALGRELYARLGLSEEYELGIAAMHHCRKIRNQYAHCIWWDDNTPRLAFGAVEEIAQENAVVELGDLVPDHVTVEFLEEQLAYFNYTDEQLIWLINASLKEQGKPHIAAIANAKPPGKPQPALRMP